MSEVKLKEIQEFVNDFDKKLKESFKKYEFRNRKERTLKKNFSQINGDIKMKEKFPSLFIKNEENKNSIKNFQLIINHLYGNLQMELQIILKILKDWRINMS